jgi:hypothetical protein
MSVEAWKTICDIAAVILLFLTFAFGAGAFIAGNIINKRQEKQLQQFDKDLTDAKIELGKQQERAATAEKDLLELQERIKPRILTDKQSTEFVRVLKTFPNGVIDVGYTAGSGDEGFNLVQQLRALFKQAGWTVPENPRDIAQHLEIQVIGVGVLVRGPAASDPSKPPPSGYVVLTPLLKTIQAAFRTVRIEVQFINWHPKNSETPEVVVGSKPEPKSN